MKEFVFDCRNRKGIIWNIQDIISRFPFGDSNAKWNSGIEFSEEEWIDEFVYRGFFKYGKEFLQTLKGRFSIVYHDKDKDRIFLARDWIGEMPFHYLATQTGFYFGNTINAIMNSARGHFSYEYVRAFPQSHYQLIELKNIDENNISGTVQTG